MKLCGCGNWTPKYLIYNLH